MIISTQKSLNLFLEKPLEKLRPPMVQVKVHDSVDIRVKIIAENINNCSVNIKYNTKHFKLTNGKVSNILDGSSFSKKLSWILKAIKISNNHLITRITAQADNLVQMSSFQTKVV